MAESDVDMAGDPAWFFTPTAPSAEDGVLVANGIDADSGLPLCRMTTAEAAEIASQPEAGERLAKQRYGDAVEPCLGVVGGVVVLGQYQRLLVAEEAEDVVDRRLFLSRLLAAGDRRSDRWILPPAAWERP